MYKKSLILIFLLMILNNCGYTPLYLGSNSNIYIEITEKNGDRDINNLLSSNLKRFSNKSEDTNKNYRIIINSVYKKNIIAKNTQGASTDYRLITEVSFKINSKDKTKIINFSESFNMKGLNNNFEEKDYESSIKKNMVDTIIQKLILQLNTIK
jgi:hypothetical protein